MRPILIHVNIMGYIFVAQKMVASDNYQPPFIHKYGVHRTTRCQKVAQEKIAINYS